MKRIDKNSIAHVQDALAMLRELDRALSLHLDWLKHAHRVLICDEPPRPNDLAEDAHRHCCFGAWFYGLTPAIRDEYPGLGSMEEPHQVMHDAARELLAGHRHGQPVSSERYEAFMDLAMDFKMAIVNCQNQLIGQVCTVDHLTGAWNRHAMISRLTEEMERVRRSGSSCALCLVDLDFFKRVNDEHGHSAGDAVLRAVSRFLKGGIRPYDSLFRYGGEEFLICLPNTRLADAELLLNRLREDLARLEVEIGGGGRLRLTASFGVAEMEAGEAIEVAVERADHALLCAKANGRDQVCAWDLSRSAGDTPAQASAILGKR